MRWRLSLWYFFYFAFIGAFAPYFTLYLQSLNIGAPEIGVLMSLMLVMRILAPNLWGWLVTRCGHDLMVIRISAVSAATCAGLFFFVHDTLSIFVVMACLSFFWAASLPLVEALTLRQLEHCPHDYGRIRLWGSIGFICAVLGTGAWLNYGSLSDLLWINLGLLAGVTVGAAMLREAPAAISVDHGTDRHLGKLPRDVVALLVAGFFMAAAHGPFYVFFSIHLVNLGYEKFEVGALWSLGVVAEIIVFYLMPRLLRNCDLRHMLLATYLLAVVRFMLIGWVADDLLWLMVAQVLHGATFGACHAATVAMLNMYFSAAKQARIQALYGSLAYGAGGMFGNLESGMAWGAWGPAATFSSGAFFALVGAIIGFLAWRPDRRVNRGAVR